MLRRVTTTLEALSSYGELPGAPAVGRLADDVEPPGFEALAGLMQGGRPRPASHRVPVPLSKPAAKPAQRTPKVDAAKARDEHKRLLAGPRLLYDAERTAGAARKQAERAAAEAEAAAARAHAIERDREQIERQLSHASKELAAAQERARKAAADVGAAAAAADSAERAVELARRRVEQVARRET